MDNRNYGRQDRPQKRPRGFIDDYMTGNVETPETIRKKDGGLIHSNPLAEQDRNKKRVTKQSRKRYRKQTAGVIAFILFFVLVIGFSVFLIIKNNNSGADPSGDSGLYGETDIAETQTVPGTQSVQDTPHGEESITVNPGNGDIPVIKHTDNSDIHRGNLILVNYKYEYIFPEESSLVPMYDKSDVFSLSSADMVLDPEALSSFRTMMNDLYAANGCDEVLAVSTFRSYEKQQEIYDSFLEQYGSEYTVSHVADPGFSEHHTGLALDLEVYSGGLVYDIENYAGTVWFMDHYQDYGYILRYPSDKAGITSIDFEAWHYRYTGLPHSLIMKSQNLCHEEYIDYLRGYTKESGPLLFNGATGEITRGEWTLPSPGNTLIYYVKASEGETTDIPLLSESSEISGNNVDGFIVTLKG